MNEVHCAEERYADPGRSYGDDHRCRRHCKVIEYSLAPEHESDACSMRMVEGTCMGEYKDGEGLTYRW